MRMAGRIWRLIKSEVNSRMGYFETSKSQPKADWKEPPASKPYATTEEAQRARYYRILELPNGAPLYNVKASYKRLMKKYHPDKFQTEEQKAAATELVKKLNEAYRELCSYLENKAS